MSTARPIKHPLLYTPELFAAICKRIAEGEFLNAICKEDGMPGASTVREWVVDNVDGCAAVYARARTLGYDSMAEDILAISDTPQEGKKVIAKPLGEEITTGDMIDHRRLRVESRKWLLAKLRPELYG